ncbi:hypothetical protein ZWY2020_058648 [Hordeum vulgare]|nr:hypothetical protein ZWY2020_058648 [Hordeum vulgare]
MPSAVRTLTFPVAIALTKAEMIRVAPAAAHSSGNGGEADDATGRHGPGPSKGHGPGTGRARRRGRKRRRTDGAQAGRADGMAVDALVLHAHGGSGRSGGVCTVAPWPSSAAPRRAHAAGMLAG